MRTCKAKTDRQHSGKNVEAAKVAIRSRISRDRQNSGKRFKDTKEVIRSHTSRKGITVGKSMKIPNGNQKL
jgi:hypothetical protein